MMNTARLPVFPQAVLLTEEEPQDALCSRRKPLRVDEKQQPLRRSRLKLPAVSLGLWHNFGEDTPMRTKRAICQTAFDLGITHFDLANNYGPPPGSRRSPSARSCVRILPAIAISRSSPPSGYDMWPGPYGEWGSRKYVLASLDQSLKRMGLDYVDIFYSHRFDPETPLEETMMALDTAVRSGRALYAASRPTMPSARARPRPSCAISARRC